MTRDGEPLQSRGVMDVLVASASCIGPLQRKLVMPETVEEHASHFSEPERPEWRKQFSMSCMCQAAGAIIIVVSEGTKFYCRSRSA